STLTDRDRPLEGGLQIRWDNYLCTFGFNALLSTSHGLVDGFVINSHCTTKQGGVNGTKYYQPLDKLAADLIGTEFADPAYKRGVANCPAGKVCRRSDSAFVQRDPSASAAGLLGVIAKTDTVNTGSLTMVDDMNKHFHIK